MGIYAQTNFAINCKDNKTAKEVKKVIKALKEDEHGNTYGQDIEIYGTQVEGFMSSGRYQNLEYRCEKIWEAVKDIKGVEDANFPFLSEAEGCFFSND